jgi:outer membrane protein OmpA-like peptidoglycan-associated protein
MKLCFSSLLGLASLCCSAQNTPSQDLPPGYYVVVAAYLSGQEAFAQNYSAKINQEGRHSGFGFDPTRKFYYVYLDHFTEFNESISQMLRARKDGFDKAWVRIMKGDMSAVKTNPVVENKNVDNKSVIENKVPSPTQVTEKPAVAKPEEPKSPVESKEPAMVRQIVPDPVPSTTPVKETAPVVEVSKSDPLFHPELLTAGVMLTLYNPTNNMTIDGEVEVVDSERAKLIAKAKGNEYYTLPDPKSKSGKLLLISNSFGYRRVQHELNYKNSDKDSLPPFMDVVDNHYRIKFDMDRMHKGDIAVLYNVYFYNDAAIMQPDSRYELNKLLQMMKENPAIKIVLHGHTNGNAHGKIISMGNSKDFFTLNSDVKNGFGSAKELSRVRAQIIKDWLISNGVSADRMEVQAHGGRRMIHDKNSANAKRNVRVEVEVVSE